MASAGNVDASVTLAAQHRRRRQLSPRLAAGRPTAAAAAVAYDNAAAHCPSALARADSRAAAYRNAMCHCC